VPGPTLGRYKLAARIAQGGMGEVYRGVDVGFGGIERPVAVKLIAPALALDPSLKRQFIDEAKLSYLLCHQNVIGVRDVGEIDGRFFIAMEWVDGADLGTILQRLRTAAGQPLPLRFACLVAVEAARGLDYAHRARDAAGQALHLVHRDISPSNLLVSFEGEIKVSDFGIARSRLREVTSMPGGLKGKIGYMAPEQARGEALDARADVFSLGAVLFEMLTAHNPFIWDQPRENEALERVRQARFPSVRTLASSVPQGLEAVVMRAMAPERRERYQSCDKMREDLESFARRESYTLSPSDFGQFVRDLLEAPGPEPERAKTATPPKKRLSGTRAVAAPRAFNDALGGALASLGGSEDEEGAAGNAGGAATEAQVIVASVPPPKATVVAKPVHAHRAVTPAPEPVTQPGKARPPTDSTDLIPRTGSRVPLFVGVAVVLVAAAAGAVWYAMRTPEPAAAVVPPPVVAAPKPAAAMAASPPPVVAAQPIVVAAPPATLSRPTKADKHHARHGVAAAPVAAPTTAPAAASPAPAPPAPSGPAHLTLTADVQADAYIDGQYIRATPIVDYELPPGKHTIHLESAAPGLRLIPRDRIVELKPGELKEIRMELK